MLLFYIWLMYIDKIKECIFIYDIHSLDFYFILIIFLDNSFILSDRICSFPSILTSKYMLRVIGNIDLNNIDPNSKNSEIGICINPKY